MVFLLFMILLLLRMSLWVSLRCLCVSLCVFGVSLSRLLVYFGYLWGPSGWFWGGFEVALRVFEEPLGHLWVDFGYLWVPSGCHVPYFTLHFCPKFCPSLHWSHIAPTCQGTPSLRHHPSLSVTPCHAPSLPFIFRHFALFSVILYHFLSSL